MVRVLKRAALGLSVFAVFIIAAHEAYSQGYPNRPVRLIVPYPPGGASDVLARAAAQRLSENVGKQILVENRPGGGGNIAADSVAKSPADGYTLLFGGTPTLAINPSLYAKMPFDPLTDFAPIGLAGSLALTMVVSANFPVYSVNDLIALAKSKPGQLNYASAGVGGTTFLAMEMFKTAAGVQITHIPYKGTTAGLADMMGGSIQVMFDSWVTSDPLVKAGKLRYLGVASAKRSALNPDVPTIIESGFPGLEVSVWHGLVAPAGTPPDIINKLSVELMKVTALPEYRERLATIGMEPLTNTPSQFAAYIRSETAKWAEVVRNSGVKAE
ncbi:MAG: tripartite tricarboxylate transporter substrate binding protein [Betaproteobacteria bacterium]|nr:tripartite tricarboxylate transporter substrate binding protein [Betaproteobacteria bacterium]